MDTRGVSIYLITNTVNGKRYIGQTVRSVEVRWKQHINDAHTDWKRGCRALWNAIVKYGADCFKVETLVVVSKKHANDYEKRFIDMYGTLTPRGYNILPGGNVGDMPTSVRESIGRKLRTRTAPDIPTCIQEQRIGQNVGHMVRVNGKYLRSFTSSRYSMEEKLEAAKNFLDGLAVNYDQPQLDTSLPKYIAHRQSKGIRGYRIEFRLSTGKKFTRGFTDRKLTMEQKLELAKQFLASCVWQNGKPIAPPPTV